MTIFISIYNPVELYPPTINAISFLAKRYDAIILVTNSVEGINRWIFPNNVKVYYSGSWPKNGVNLSFWGRIKRFLYYVYGFNKILMKNYCSIVLLYEPYAALAYVIGNGFKLTKPKVLWYHNHDIVEASGQGKISIGRLAIIAEKKLMIKSTIFSLPANERSVFFPMNKFKGKYFFIPNYPSLEFYRNFPKAKQSETTLRIIFQGRIAEGHGLEAIISLLNKRILGRELTLHLKGIVSEVFKNKLMTLASSHNVLHRLLFYDLSSYLEVPKLTSSCHVGIAIHTMSDVMNKTLGTSSNKIYEYAAVGLPVVLYDNAHFRKHLEKYKWAFFTDCSEESLYSCLKNIILDLDRLSYLAHNDFVETLNFERQIMPVVEYIDKLKV